ncbi:transposase [Rhizobium leguminosarum bv. phaseoli CCGM1]|nr:transposase [Rhizobium leguminosarum bv. phaseoli CCGM1]
MSYLQQASEQLPLTAGPAGELWQTQLRHYKLLIDRIIGRTERRVLAGEPVPAGEKLVSLFEPHADIIVEGSRGVDYGHKLNLTTGRSGLVLDLVVETGNRQTASVCCRCWNATSPFMARRRIRAGYASRDNLSRAKACGIRDMAFHKKCGLKIEDMVGSRGLSQAQKLPRRHRGRHLMFETRLWLGALHLAWARPLQGLCLVIGGRLQSRPLCPPPAGSSALVRRTMLSAMARTFFDRWPTSVSSRCSDASSASIRRYSVMSIYDPKK